MLAAIGDAKTCPHGHPIVAGTRIQGVPLADVEVGATVTVLRFENEAEDLLHYLKATGIEPGLEGTRRARRRTATSSSRRAASRTITVDAHVAETVSVIADPSPPPRVALPEQLVLGARPLRALSAGRTPASPRRPAASVRLGEARRCPRRSARA